MLIKYINNIIKILNNFVIIKKINGMWSDYIKKNININI